MLNTHARPWRALRECPSMTVWSSRPPWAAWGSSGKSNRNCMVHLSGHFTRSASAPDRARPAHWRGWSCAIGHPRQGHVLRTMPLMQLRLRVRQLPRRNGPRRLLPEAHCLASQRDSGKGIKLACAQSRCFPSRGGVTRATVQEKTPCYDTGVQYQTANLGVNSGGYNFARSLCASGCVVAASLLEVGP